MSDRMSAHITIGGPLRRSALDRFLGAITDCAVSLDWGEPDFAPAGEDELKAGLNDGVLELCHDEAPWGQFPSLEALCPRLGLSFRRWSAGKYEYGAEIGFWRPGMAESARYPGDQSNETVIYVPAEVVRRVIGLLDGGVSEGVMRGPPDVDAALEILRAACPEIPSIPPLEIIDG